MLFKKFVFILVLFASASLSANQFVLKPGSPATIVNSTDSSIMVASPSVDGVSINDFSEFTVNSKKLVIYNNQDNPAQTILIRADKVGLYNEIELIGKTADLIVVVNAESNADLINTNYIGMVCGQCGFKNAGRVTLTVGTYTPSSGIINVYYRGNILIRGLKAPGVQSVEVVANTIDAAGIIDTNLKGTAHPNGGFAVTDNGNLVIGSGGITFYASVSLLDYKTLTVQDAYTEQRGSLTLAGTINAASIGVLSASTISSSANLSTDSDLLATSNRLAGIYAPIEGIFFETVKNTQATIHLSGHASSDRIVSVKSYGSIVNAANIVSNSTLFIAGEYIHNKGYISDAGFSASSNYFMNTGRIDSSNVSIESVKDINNSFGGKITANDIVLTSQSGTVINGSRSGKMLLGENKTHLDTLVDYTSLKQGSYYKISEPSGVDQPVLSGTISANSIKIQAVAFENINPYYLEKSTSESWQSGIKVSTEKSRQVSLLAERSLQIKTSKYVLNSSGIIGLNQNGEFEINSPVVLNERYRLEADSFIVSTFTYSDKPQTADQIKKGTETKVIKYSPPGRLYSFGKLRVSDGATNEEIVESFTNAFSYFEVFGDVHFHQTKVKTIGLQLSESVTFRDEYKSNSCLTYGSCTSTTQTTVAEAETLFSIQGSVFGINKDTPSLADLVVTNLNVHEVEIQNLVRDYLASFAYRIDEENYKYISKSEVNNKILKASWVECKGMYRTREDIYEPLCKYGEISKSIDELIKEKSTVGDTSLTDAQIYSALVKHISTLKDSVPTHIPYYYYYGEKSRTLKNYALNGDKFKFYYSVIYLFFGGNPPYGYGMTLERNKDAEITVTDLKKYLN
ncbi:MAG: filamentous hemagglutinin N-terminal domain-containing protein [Gammaproteobacteria bacterium]|nr:filamentous hemagglutinin N-terminal domain-containing protein [Gammaproteobacteria bacterium]MBU2059416.1 filamentous hemagglutinin N-terminal domain-containing protein [Gammaproteobacteria bacterium]MBU2175204.1 filamentous hemagglutinin N-terminal domain-containing protein [Gammaproteobacteria bacterium]MBU2247412.1 filamentous hemagglutinin N-terminal domain-containing protein [Gammaproteobacteria bacterium]MBU2346321.1 filamentous hemagglutinin N-terminal domain-containing protein [Gamm